MSITITIQLRVEISSLRYETTIGYRHITNMSLARWTVKILCAFDEQHKTCHHFFHNLASL